MSQLSRIDLYTGPGALTHIINQIAREKCCFGGARECPDCSCGTIDASTYVYVYTTRVRVSLTFSLHAHSQALLEAAVGAAFPLGGVHGATLSLCTGVVLVILHGTLEEALRGDGHVRETDRG